jgi:hypothetical protein
MNINAYEFKFELLDIFYYFQILLFSNIIIIQNIYCLKEKIW